MSQHRSAHGGSLFTERAQQPRATAPAPTKRHRWVKLELHLYICRDCGCGRENAETQPGWWATTYTMPDGTSKVLTHVPPCAVGPLTATYLEPYAEQIAAWKGHRASIEMRPAIPSDTGASR